MQNKITTYSGIIIAVGLLFANAGYAFDMGNVMNPSKWMGGNNNRDRYDDDRGYGGPGYGGPGYGGPGYGYGGPGYGGPGSYYGGAPGYSYGAPGYGGAPAYGGAPGYGYEVAPGYGGAPAYGAAPAGADSAEQIERLQERIRVLEEAAKQAPATNPAWGNTQPGGPAPAAPYGNQSGYQYR